MGTRSGGRPAMALRRRRAAARRGLLQSPPHPGHRSAGRADRRRGGVERVERGPLRVRHELVRPGVRGRRVAGHAPRRAGRLGGRRCRGLALDRREHGPGRRRLGLDGPHRLAPAGRPLDTRRDVSTWWPDGDEVGECYVTQLSGPAGGVEANLNRWCQQMGAEALTPRARSTRSIPCGSWGFDAKLLEVDGHYTGMGGESVEEAPAARRGRSAATRARCSSS